MLGPLASASAGQNDTNWCHASAANSLPKKETASSPPNSCRYRCMDEMQNRAHGKKVTPQTVAQVLSVLGTRSDAEIRKQYNLSRQQLWRISKNPAINGAKPQASNSSEPADTGKVTARQGKIPLPGPGAVSAPPSPGAGHGPKTVPSPKTECLKEGVTTDSNRGSVDAIEILPSDQGFAAPLTLDEKHDLHEQKQIILKGWTTFIEVGRALLEIRNRRLYREHGSFEQFCRDVLGFSKTHANRQISAARVATALQDRYQQLTESMIRPLTSLRNPASIQRTWDIVISKAEGRTPTAALVESVVLSGRRSIKPFKQQQKLRRKPGYNDVQQALRALDEAEQAARQGKTSDLLAAFLNIRKVLGRIEKRLAQLPSETKRKTTPALTKILKKRRG